MMGTCRQVRHRDYKEGLILNNCHVLKIRVTHGCSMMPPSQVNFGSGIPLLKPIGAKERITLSNEDQLSQLLLCICSRCAFFSHVLHLKNLPLGPTDSDWQSHDPYELTVTHRLHIFALLCCEVSECRTLGSFFFTGKIWETIVLIASTRPFSDSGHLNPNSQAT